jgi:c-di-GMP-related signal transduction protein
MTMAREFSSRGIAMLAEKVESYDDFREAQASGYTMSQGYFFCHPEVIASKDIPSSNASLANLIAEVNRPEVDFEGLEAVIKRDVARSVRVLRYLQSAGLGWRHEVNSIELILNQLSLGEEVRGALLGHDNVLGNCLRAARAYDRPEWDDVDRYAVDAGIPQAEVAGAYQRSLQWVTNGAFAN